MTIKTIKVDLWLLAASYLALACVSSAHAEQACCGEFSYDTDIQECCNGVVVNKGNCCGGEELKFGEICCGGTPALPEECCGDKKMYEDDLCCGNKIYKQSSINLLCCNNLDTYLADLTDEKYGVDITSVGDVFKTKINQLLNSIPGAPAVEVASAGVHGVYAQSNCCRKTGLPIKKGLKKYEGGIHFSANLIDHLVWPNFPKEAMTTTFGLGGDQITIKAKCGAYLTLSVEVNATVGNIENACNPDESCSYGYMGMAFGPLLTVGMESEVKVNGKDYDGIGVFSLQPLVSQMLIKLDEGYNPNKKCGKGWSGSGIIGAFKISSELNIFGLTCVIDWKEFPLIKLL